MRIDLALTAAARPFLTARWLRLCLFDDAVEPGVLEPHLPPGPALDRFDGQAHVPLVAFDFRDTRATAGCAESHGARAPPRPSPRGQVVLFPL